MGAMASQITSLIIVYSNVYSGTDQRKHQRSASLAFLRGIHRWPMNSPHKWPVTRKMFPFNDVIMTYNSAILRSINWMLQTPMPCIFHIALISHYSDVIKGAMASQITSVSIVYSTVCSGGNQRNHQSSVSLAFVRRIHPVTGEFLAQKASNVENDSIWWRHHEYMDVIFPTKMITQVVISHDGLVNIDLFLSVSLNKHLDKH